MTDPVTEPAGSKTLESQQTKGQQSYYYWHSAVPQGDQAAPKPSPHQLSSQTLVKEQPPKPIESYAFLDDGDVVKVYIPLDGPLASLTADGVSAEYQERSLRVVLRPTGSDRDHVLAVRYGSYYSSLAALAPHPT